MKILGNRKTVCIILFLILCSVTACGKRSLEPEEVLPEDQQENIIIAGEAEQEIIEDSDEENVNADAGKEEEEQEEDEEMEETLPTYTYRGDAVLTQENFRKTMKTFLCIKSSREFYKLEELPLTEKFFNECLEDFPFINDLDDMKEFYIAFWGVGEQCLEPEKATNVFV